MKNWFYRFAVATFYTWVVVGLFGMTSVPPGGVEAGSILLMLLVLLAVSAFSGGLCAAIFRKNDLTMVVASQVIAISIISGFVYRGA